MRGHGVTAVGNSIRQAVFRAVYTEINAKLHLEAIKLGPVIYLTAKRRVKQCELTTAK